MNLRNAINFATKTKSGRTVMFLAGIGMLVLLLGRGKGETKGQESPQKAQQVFPKLADQVKPKTETEDYVQQRPYSPAKASTRQPRAVSAAREYDYVSTPPPKQEASLKEAALRPKRLSIRLFANPPVQHSEAAATPRPQYESVQRNEAFAPYGRLLQCELVLTVDSTTYDTPILGLVTQDLWWSGKILIPANSEVFGTAKRGRVRNRVGDTGRWIIVLASGGVHPAGTELILNGSALDMDYDINTQKWALTDGSAGLRGDVVTEENALEEVKFFAATALSAAANGLVPQTNTVFGQVPQAGLQTAGTEAASAVLERYADRVLQAIEENGYFTRVPAGKQFYLFIRQDLLMREARYAASTLSDPTATVLASRQNVLQQAQYQAEVERAQGGMGGLLSMFGGGVAQADTNGDQSSSSAASSGKPPGVDPEMVPYLRMMQQAARPIQLPNGTVVDPLSGSIRSN